MPPVDIRIATRADRPFLRRMQWEALQASPQFLAAMGIDPVRQREEQTWAAWPGPDEVAFVAEDPERGIPLGAVILRVHERAAGLVIGFRLVIGVEKAARRQGIGRLLIERAQAHAREQRAEYVTLDVDAANEPAIRAYRATSFAPGDRHHIVPMTWWLDQDR
jgi:ribosomal protein S18 acetylase RimI-like enzyme